MANLPPTVIAGGIVLFIGFILATVGIFSNGWNGDSDVHKGLFRACILSSCNDIKLSDYPSYWKATVALEILAFLAALVALASAATYVILTVLNKASETVAIVTLVTLIASIVEVVLAILGCVVFVGKYVEVNKSITLNYSFFLTIIGSIIVVIGGTVFYSGSKKRVGAV